jgi:hypothetical protein
MMTVSIKHQEHFSRGALILRTLFGWLYIATPHFFLLFLAGAWGGVLSFLAWFAVLFTGKYPESFHRTQVGLLSLSTQFAASMGNLTDEYPVLGVQAPGAVAVELAPPASSSRGLLILRTLFSLIYVIIPHGFCLIFRFIWTGILSFLAWFTVLFAGTYPASWHSFNVGTTRWGVRVAAYLYFLTDDYPPFSGK